MAMATETARNAKAESNPPSAERLVHIPVDLIDRNPEHPRKQYQEKALKQLADSFVDIGILQPLVLRKLPQKTYQIVIGERRWRAACLAGLDTVPAVVKECSDEEALISSLVENTLSEQLNVFEQAEAFERLIKYYGHTHQSVANSIKKSRSYVTNRLRLLEISDGLKLYYDCGLLGASHLIVLMGIPEDYRMREAEHAVRKNLTSKGLEEVARRKYDRTNKKTRPKSDPNIDRLARQLSEITGCRVRIDHSSSGQGKVELNYFSVEELEGVLQRFDLESID